MATLKRNLWVLVVGLGFTPTVFGQANNPYVAQGGLGAGANPYTGMPGGGISNPYQGYGGGYGGYGYGYDPTGLSQILGAPGQMLHGLADVYRSYGTVITSQEQTRILREQSMQAKIDTARRRFDFQLYVRANTPTFADEQRRIARNTLNRIQIASMPQEIVNGKSLNILMDDVRRFYKKPNMDPIPLSESILSHINVTTKALGVGILRDGGRLDWPIGLLDLLSPEQRQAIERQTQTLVADASKGKIDRAILDDLNTRLAEVKNQLAKRVNDIPTAKYLEADQFLSDFKDARQAVGEGQMEAQNNFEQFIKGGKTVQEFTDYLVANGLRLAPATPRDDAAYRALHSAMVAFDIVLNTQSNAEAKESTPTTGTGATP